MEELIIRRAEAGDVRAVAEIEAATSAAPWSEAVLLKDITENPMAIVLVAEIGGVIAGYADAWCIAGESELNNIAVLELFRGRHYGDRLLSELMEQAGRSCTNMNLEVRTGNEVAIALYEKKGFVRNGLRQGYYQDNGEDAVLMTAEI